MSLLGTSGSGGSSTGSAGVVGSLLGGGSTGAGVGGTVGSVVDTAGALLGGTGGTGGGSAGGTNGILDPVIGPLGAIDVGHLLDGLTVLDLPVLLDAHLANQDLADAALHLHGGNLYAGPNVDIGGILGTEQGELVQLAADTTLGSVAFGSGDDRLISPDAAVVTGIIDGGDGNDQLGVGIGDAELRGGAGDDRLEALGDGDNRIDGGAGVDYMAGGRGDDTYVVDNRGDVVAEAADEGNDTVESSINYTLAPNVENLVLTGHDTINGVGNALANHLVGNDAANILDGYIGADVMEGGAGDDTYAVDNAGDRVIEGANAGTDLVKATVNFTLGDNVENLQFLGDADLNGHGNDLANRITGNNGDNMLWGGLGNDVIDGRAGVDTLIGGLGNDTYGVNTTADTVVENANEGIDRINSTVSYTLPANVENLELLTAKAINGSGNELANVLTGNDGANRLMGLAGDDTLNGGNGDDLLIGGAGKDVMTGGAGADTFAFQSAADFGGKASTTSDVITDFSHADGDRIDLSRVDANSALGGFQHFSFVGNAAAAGLGQLAVSFVNGDTFLWADTNGDHAADFVVRLTGHQDLTAADILV